MRIRLKVFNGIDEWYLMWRNLDFTISKRSIYVKKLKLKAGDYVEISIKKVKQRK